MAKERELYRCPCCAKISPLDTFERALEPGYQLEVRVVRFPGGGRSGRPKEPMRDERGKVVLGADGKPRMVLARDEHDKALAGPGFAWSSRDLRPEEREMMARVVNVVGRRIEAQLITDVLMNIQERDDFDNLCGQYLAEAHNEFTEREALVDAIRRRRT